jgi:rhomboid family GlyGly-CTERM serine protease
MQLNQLYESLKDSAYDNKSVLFFVIIALISTLLWLPGDVALEALEYNRGEIGSGQIWRLLSGHFVHSNGWHLLLNIASLVLIGLLFSQHLTSLSWSIIFIISGLLISACYYWIAPQFEYYVGLSAILYAVIIVGAMLDLREQPLIATIVLVVVTGRVIWQQFYGSVDSLASIIEDRVAIESHLFGIASGYLQGIVLLARQYYLSNKN